MPGVDDLPNGPFTRAAARGAGVTNRMLQGKRFVRIYPRVWRRRDHDMTAEDWVTAARLALPPYARLTGISRLQALGLDHGPRLPVRFVVEGPLHLAFDNVFLHRTKKLPPTDDVGVTVEAAFIAYCALARVIDALKVGDWLAHRNHLDLATLEALAVAELWRPGAQEVLWLLDHLDPRCRSMMESELRALLKFAGLPLPEVNASIDVGPDAAVVGDLWFAAYLTLVEFEGEHHQVDRGQYRRDIDRYELVRDANVRYVQITREHVSTPRIAVGRVYRTLVKAGYDGPPPRFSGQWKLLFGSLSAAVGPRDWGRRTA